MPDRSIVTSELNLDRDVGATLFSKDLLGLGGKLGYNLVKQAVTSPLASIQSALVK